MKEETRKDLKAFSKRNKQGLPIRTPQGATASKEGTKPLETRKTYIVKDAIVERIIEISKESGLLIKEVVDAAFTEFINNYDNNK